MRFDAVFTEESCSTATDHLLQHYRRGDCQEDLCFALWRPSTGQSRRTALIDEIILPAEDERILHGGVSCQPHYISRALRAATDKGMGLAFMHSHPGPGWQALNAIDAETEGDVLAYPAGATALPLVGLTLGSDGYWSARFWERDGKKMRCRWCDKVRIVGPMSYKLYFNDNLRPAPQRRNILKRTIDAWGRKAQNDIARLKVGIVGLGSGGSVVAEAVARIGVEQVVLIDHDRVEEHNLDRLLNATVKDIGRPKVEVAAKAMRRNGTAKRVQVTALPMSIQDEVAYLAALDCDVLFGCVDRPVPLEILNYAAHSHLIPVFSGAVEVQTNPRNDGLFSAHWRAHTVTPYHQCLRCNRQYNSSAVVKELDGSLDDLGYISNLPANERPRNENVFPFGLSVAAMIVNSMIRYLLAPDWWSLVRQQEHQLITGKTQVTNEECRPNCEFRRRRAAGDAERPYYLNGTLTAISRPNTFGTILALVKRRFRSCSLRLRRQRRDGTP